MPAKLSASWHWPFAVALAEEGHRDARPPSSSWPGRARRPPAPCRAHRDHPDASEGAIAEVHVAVLASGHPVGPAHVVGQVAVCTPARNGPRGRGAGCTSDLGVRGRTRRQPRSPPAHGRRRTTLEPCPVGTASGPAPRRAASAACSGRAGRGHRESGARRRRLWPGSTHRQPRSPSRASYAVRLSSGLAVGITERIGQFRGADSPATLTDTGRRDLPLFVMCGSYPHVVSR